MKLSDTTFSEFIQWCRENKKEWYPYMTAVNLRIIYNYCVTHNLKCEGRNFRLSWKGNEFISSWSVPYHGEITREMLVWEMFHDVWCKTEWAVRCGVDKQALGYSAVVSEFGINTIKQLKNERRIVA